MGHLYIIKDTGYQEYKDLLETGIKIKDMNSYLEHHRDEELLNESKRSKKTLLKCILLIIIFLLLSLGVYFVITKFGIFPVDDIKVSTEGIVSK